MKIDIKKAYDYYINNISKSCDNRVLDEKSFHEAFPAFLQQLHIDEVMHSNSQHIPIYNDKCKTSRIVNLETVLKKNNMKYRHVKTGIIFTKHSAFDYYENEGGYFIPSEIVEDSNEWKPYKEITEDIKKLQNIPCLSINDIAKVYVTANKESYNNEMGLEKQGIELIKLVQEKLNK